MMGITTKPATAQAAKPNSKPKTAPRGINPRTSSTSYSATTMASPMTRRVQPIQAPGFEWKTNTRFTIAAGPMVGNPRAGAIWNQPSQATIAATAARASTTPGRRPFALTSFSSRIQLAGLWKGRGSPSAAAPPMAAGSPANPSLPRSLAV